MAQFFGIHFQRNPPEEQKRLENIQSVAAPIDDEGAVSVGNYGGVHGQYIDIDLDIRNENQLIDKYREISIYPEVNRAVDMITSESIVVSDQESSVKLNLDNVDELSEKIKDRVHEEFEEILRLLHFSIKGHDIFRQWYIDGRINYNILVDDERPQEGIAELRFIDPKKIKKVREIQTNQNARNERKNVDTQSQFRDSLISNKNIREYFLYYPNGSNGEQSQKNNIPGQSMNPRANAIRMTKDSIAYANSGEIDYKTNSIISFLHKAIRPANNLKMLEDSIIIYSLSRAPERRVFYIDTGTLPGRKSREYVNNIKTQYRNKLAFDANTGEIKDNPRHLAITEDYWLPRREGSRGTEISTLSGGEQLGETRHAEYFREKLYQSLYAPKSRFEDQPTMFSSGTDITRDEVYFSRFIDRLRRRFALLFQDLLGKQLVSLGCFHCVFGKHTSC